MLLTEEERRRFADYLDVDADSNEQIAAQMDRVGAVGPIATLAKQKRMEAAAERLVSKMLRSAQSMTLEAPPRSEAPPHAEETE